MSSIRKAVGPSLTAGSPTVNRCYATVVSVLCSLELRSSSRPSVPHFRKRHLFSKLWPFSIQLSNSPVLEQCKRMFFVLFNRYMLEFVKANEWLAHRDVHRSMAAESPIEKLTVIREHDSLSSGDGEQVWDSEALLSCFLQLQFESISLHSTVLKE